MLCAPGKNPDASYVYYFDGWYTGTNGSGVRVTENSVASSNLTVYAKWRSDYQRNCANYTMRDGKKWCMVEGEWTWSSAQSHCPSGYRVATKDEITTLNGLYSGRELFAAFGRTGGAKAFWSSTSFMSGNAYHAYLIDIYWTSTSVYEMWYGQNYLGVACIGR